MSRAARRQEFPSDDDKVIVVTAYVKRKLVSLKQGVAWSRTKGSRVSMAAFGGIKKHGVRILQRQVQRKYATGRESHFLLHKLAVHLVLTGKQICCSDKVPTWTNGDDRILSNARVRELLLAYAPKPLSARERRLLDTEIHTAARCSLHLLFGRET